MNKIFQKVIKLTYIIIDIIVISFCEKHKIYLEITQNSSSSNFSLKNTIKDKETNTSSNSKTQSYIKKASAMKKDDNKQFFYNSINFRKDVNKPSGRINNTIINLNKKNDNKNISSNTKLLYEKMKKNTYTNNFKKNEPKKNEIIKSFKKRDSMPFNKTASIKINNRVNINKKRKYTVKNNNNNYFNSKYNENNSIIEKERRFSTSEIHRPILSFDDISSSFNEMKEKRNKIIHKFKKEKISSKEQALYILSTSPFLRLCEQLIFANSTKNIKNVIKLENILNNHIIFLNAKANELQNEISLCEKRINTPFVASKIADITLNFITSTDEQEFKNYDVMEINKDEINNYYNYIKLLCILFNENYDNKISGKNLKEKLFNKLKEKGFNYIRDYLYHIYIAKKEDNNIVSKIDIINNDIIKISPNLLNIHDTLKICRFIAFTNYLVKEIIAYGNNINDMLELKYRAQNLLDIVFEKIDKIQNKNKGLEKEKKISNL